MHGKRERSRGQEGHSRYGGKNASDLLCRNLNGASTDHLAVVGRDADDGEGGVFPSAFGGAGALAGDLVVGVYDCDAVAAGEGVD